jgi:hypothetical protein
LAYLTAARKPIGFAIALLLDKSVRGDGKLGRALLDHHDEEDLDADHAPEQQDQRRPGLEIVPPVELRPADDGLALAQTLLDV